MDWNLEGGDCDSAKDAVTPRNKSLEHPTRRLEYIIAEVLIYPHSTLKLKEIEQRLVVILKSLGCIHVPIKISDFTSAKCLGDMCASSLSFLTEHVCSISLFLSSSDSEYLSQSTLPVNLKSMKLNVHAYKMTAGDEAEAITETTDICGESVNSGRKWMLPSPYFDGLWESLIFESGLKNKLLQYAESALLFSDKSVSPTIISWNRMILLHGPPGTGKTSLCQGLSQKLAMRLSSRYSSVQLVEISSENLLSKWFSESAKFVSGMFLAIEEYLEEPSNLMCLLIDEVESLARTRSCQDSGEPSDALRVVNAVLTHIDRLKRFPNVIVMATSNVTGVLDSAFLDRADIRMHIGQPAAAAVYTIFVSCLKELERVGIIQTPSACGEELLPWSTAQAREAERSHLSSASQRMLSLARSSVGLSGRTIRKLPLIAHAFFLPECETCMLNDFLDALELAISKHFEDSEFLTR